MKTIQYSLFVLALFTSLAFFEGCSDDTNPLAPTGPNTSSFVYIGEQYAIGGRAKVMFYAADSLFTGYNKIYIVLYDSVTNNLITDAHIEFSPANHGVIAPVENPEALAVNGIFEGAVVFTDPQVSDDPRHWHFHIHVHNHHAPGEPSGEAEFGGFPVLDKPGRFFNYRPDTLISFTFALINPLNATTGLNDYEFLVSEKVGAVYKPFPWFNFDSMSVSQGNQVSSGNELPVPIGNGRYKGKLNFPNPGEWNIFMLFQHHSGGPIHSANIFRINAQ
jgi:hypothetical protein